MARSYIPNQTAGLRTSKFHGVQRAKSANRGRPRPDSKPWQAKIKRKGGSYYLGSFETEEQAAEAWDNAAFWLSREGGFKCKELNFPDDYPRHKELDAMPQQLPATQNALIQFRMQNRCPESPESRAALRRFLADHQAALEANRKATLSLARFCLASQMKINIPDDGQSSLTACALSQGPGDPQREANNPSPAATAAPSAPSDPPNATNDDQGAANTSSPAENGSQPNSVSVVPVTSDSSPQTGGAPPSTSAMQPASDSPQPAPGDSQRLDCQTTPRR